jgi:hypothetical protein
MHSKEFLVETRADITKAVMVVDIIKEVMARAVMVKEVMDKEDTIKVVMAKGHIIRVVTAKAVTIRVAMVKAVTVKEVMDKEDTIKVVMVKAVMAKGGIIQPIDPVVLDSLTTQIREDGVIMGGD